MSVGFGGDWLRPPSGFWSRLDSVGRCWHDHRAQNPVRQPVRRCVCAAALGAAVLLAALTLKAQDFSLEWSVVAAGGGQSSGGDFVLEGSAGEAESGPMSGGDFELSEGFWSLVGAVDTPGAPPLSVTVTGGQVLLSWAASAGTNFVVEEAVVLGSPPATTTWNTVNLTPQLNNSMEVIQLPLAAGNRFYRLRSL